jgi:hypothetical protein
MAGNNSATSTPMMAITTKSSTRVNPRFLPVIANTPLKKTTYRGWTPATSGTAIAMESKNCESSALHTLVADALILSIRLIMRFVKGFS